MIWLLSGAFQESRALDWVRRTPLPFGNTIHDMTSAQGKVVAVGGGAILVSTDGLNWQPRNPTAVEDFERVTYQNGKFFAFGRHGDSIAPGTTGLTPADVIPASVPTGAILSSADGDVWKPLELGLAGHQVFRDVIWTGTQYIAVGFDWNVGRTLFAKSSDGLTWRLEPWLGQSFSPIRIASDGSKLVVLGSTGGTLDVNQATPAVLFSNDGVQWEVVAIPGLGSAGVPADLAYGNGIFAAVGGGIGTVVDSNRSSHGYIVSSPDGKTWTERTPRQSTVAPPAPVKRVVYSRGQFTAVGPGGGGSLVTGASSAAYTSADGQQWNAFFTGAEKYGGLTAIVAYPEGLLCTGADGRLYRNWTRIDTGLDGLAMGLFARGEFWFAASGSVLRTVDGTVWRSQKVARAPAGLPDVPQAIIASNTTFKGFTFTGSAFIGITGDSLDFGGYWRSTDGADWTPGELPSGRYYNSIASGNGIVVAVGDSGKIATSRDNGVNWTTANSGTTSLQLWRVAYGNGRFVALSDKSAHVSTDGINWTMASFSDFFVAYGITFYNDRFFAIRRNFTTLQDVVIASADGLNWNVQKISLAGYEPIQSVGQLIVGPDGLYCIAYGLFKSDPSGGILSTADGTNWRFLQKSDVAPLAYGGGIFLGSSSGIYSAAITPPARLANLSSLGRVGNQPLITGFVINGDVGKTLLLRSTGPTLASFGVVDPLMALTSRLYDGTGRVVDAGSPALLPLSSGETPAQVSARVGAFTQTSQDRATFVRLSPGNYTLQTAAEVGASGKALAEIYNIDASDGGAAGSLTNLSARTTLSAGDSISTVGFVIAGGRAKTVLVRGIGPALQKFGIARPIADPELTLYASGGAALAANNDWNVNDQSAAIRLLAAQRGAFALDEGSKDAAIVMTLAPGAYTVQVRDRIGAGGDILIEVYEIP